MKRFLSARLGHVLVAGDSGGFQGLRGKLLLFVGDEMRCEGKLIDAGPLATKVEDTNFRIGDSTAVPRLGVRLILAVAVASSWTCARGKGADKVSGCEILGGGAESRRDGVRAR